MAVTAPANVPNFIPGVVDAALYDRLDVPALTLTSLAAKYNELEGRPGQTVRIPTDVTVTPAANLAVDVPAVDDALGSAEFAMTIKEAVKSVAWYDRTQVQASQNVSQMAGAKVGGAVERRIEIDLGAALLAGRNTAKDGTATVLNTALIRKMRRQIPARLRRRGVVMVATDDVMGMIDEDQSLQNAQAFGSDEAIRTGAYTRPMYGVTPYVADDEALPPATIAAGTGPVVVMFALGMLGYGFQKSPSTETERDARARLTRIVGTTMHAEGTLEAAGIVVTRITG